MIQAYSFGKIVIDGVSYKGDVKIVQGRIIADWRRRSGHTVQLEDIADLLSYEPAVLVIGRGKPGLMRAAPELKTHLKTQNIQLFEESTSKAIKRYNAFFQQGRNVAAGFHLTC